MKEMKIKKGMVVKSEKNPVISYMGVCDPHLHLYKDRIYMYCSHDASIKNTTYCMNDWHIWSTVDFREWILEEIVEPKDFYMGESSNCWALDAAYKNNKCYLYYSNMNIETGVAVADHPSGPYADSLDGPILDGNQTPTREYDPAVFTDENNESYIVFGGPEWAYGKGNGYYIARLAEDMMHLAEQPRPLFVDHEADDKVSLNKINGTYYLTWGSYYAISDDVYGPYVCMGNTGASEDHGSFLEWNGQLFHSFTIFDPTMIHRASGVCYVHQKTNKELVVDEMIVEYGVGHYDTNWNKIQSQWFMRAVGVQKIENPRYGFDVITKGNGSLYYPNLEHVEGKKGISFFASCSSSEGGKIRVLDGQTGEELGQVELKFTGSLWRSYRMFTCELSQDKFQHIELELEVNGTGQIRLDYFKFY